MTNITLRQLRYFSAVARLGHFGLAADHCAISQPALSQQVRELETRLGTLLIDRSGRRPELTQAGREVESRAAAILRAVEDMESAVRASDALIRLRLGLIPTVAPYLLPGLLAMLADSGSGVELQPYEAKTQRLVQSLHDGRLDGAIVALPLADPRLHEEPLLTEDFMLARPLAAAADPVPPPHSLIENGLLLLEEGHCFRDQALAYCGTPQLGDGHRIEGSALSTLVQMVAAGLGMTLIPSMAVAMESRAARIDVTALPAPAPRRRIGLIWRRNSPLTGHLRALAGEIRGKWG